MSNDVRYFFKYLNLCRPNSNQIPALKELLNEDAVRYYEENDPLRGWVIVKQILSHRKIFLSRYTDLNDPFECLVNIDYKNGASEAVIERYHSVASPGQAIPIALSNFKNEVLEYQRLNKKHLYDPTEFNPQNALPFGIFSLSEDPDNIQMWSYYANNHNGICIAFEIDWKKLIGQFRERYSNLSTHELFQLLKTEGFQFRYTDKKGKTVNFGLQKVRYSQSVYDYPVESFMKAHFDSKFESELSWILAQNKFIKWAHENEWRLVCFNRYAEEKDDLLPLDVFDFIKPCGLVLGASMDQSVKEIIINHYEKQYPIILLKRAVSPETLTIDYSLSPTKTEIVDFLTRAESNVVAKDGIVIV